MIRKLHILAVVAVLLGCVQPVWAQPRAAALSQTSPEEAERLSKLAAKLSGEGKLAEAAPLAEQSLAIWEKALGPKHPKVAQSLRRLARIYQAQGAYAKAEPLLVRAVDIFEKTLGATDPEVASSLNNLAEIYAGQGAYAKAEPLLVRALDIFEKTLGPTHPEVARSLNDLAETYRAQGAYAKAEPLMARALDIYEKALGSVHPEVAICLNSLAKLYQTQGVYGKAEPLLLRALDIREKTLGAMHPDTARSINDLATLYHAQGDNARAEPLLVRALDIREKTLGATHPEVATSLSNLAMLYQDQGDVRVEPLLVRALAIREKALGATHPETAKILENLATFYEAQGAHARAEPLYTRALSIKEKALGTIHPDVAVSLDRLAGVYQVQGAYGRAEPLLQRALSIKEKTLGTMHPSVATSLKNLAALYQAQGAYKRAEPLYRRALDLKEKALGPTHPDIADSLNSLAGLYRAQGAYAQAEPLERRVAELRETQLRTHLGYLSFSRKRTLMALFQGETERLVSLHADSMPASPQALELALTTVVRRKGRALDAFVDNQASLRAHLNPALRRQMDQLAQARAELSTRLRSPVDPRTAKDRAAAISALRDRIDNFEAALSAANADFRAPSEPVTLAKIQAALPRGAALVEFVRYHRFDARQVSHPWQEERYVAYVLTPQDSPQWVALGDAASIDAGVDAVIAAMRSHTSPEAAKVALQRLDALVVAPLRAQLANVSHVILAPDGKLNLVPFEALLDPHGRYELEQGLMSYVTTGRDLLRLAAPHAPRSPAVLVAGPDFGPSGKAGTASFAPLAGALVEATELQKYFPNPPLTGGKATKQALAALSGPAILHIATRGFFTPDLAASPAGSQQPQSEDPADGLDRSGLALAGANKGAEGVVTAREIAGFDWLGTQLVVLSASETGIGATPSGEGVYGLRCVLVLAGTETQVVSLWDINDSSTRELMRDYYSELARGAGRAEALRHAKLHLLHQPRYAHPYYWAAFILAGNWRPLDTTVFSPRRSQP